MKGLVRIALLVMLVVASFGIMPQTERVNAASCDVLHVSATVLASAPAPVYRANGDGPGLPTPGIAVISDEQTDVSWVLYGPGSWTNVVLEWSPDGGTNWFLSVFSPPALSCSATGCAANVVLPSTAVGGAITDNAVVYGSPGVMTDTVLEIGKTFWMDGVDESGMYRKVLISCDWVWVEVAKTGPNYDEVWNGAALPGHTAD